MSKAVENVAHFSKEGEDQKLVKGMEHAKVCHVLSYIYHCNKNLIQPKLGCSSCSLVASSPGLNHLLHFVPKEKKTKILG